MRFDDIFSIFTHDDLMIRARVFVTKITTTTTTTTTKPLRECVACCLLRAFGLSLLSLLLLLLERETKGKR